MKIVFLIIFAMPLSPSIFAQTNEENNNQLNPSTTDLIILFSIIISAVVGIVIYTSREIILRKKSDYDKKDFASKKDRDYEKYHSDWLDDGYELGKSNRKKINEDFLKGLRDFSLPDYYKSLGLNRSSSLKEIKRKYRQLAKEFHPDRSKDADSKEKMAEINTAYEILSDAEKKEQYDKYLNTQ